MKSGIGESSGFTRYQRMLENLTQDELLTVVVTERLSSRGVWIT